MDETERSTFLKNISILSILEQNLKYFVDETPSSDIISAHKKLKEVIQHLNDDVEKKLGVKSE